MFCIFYNTTMNSTSCYYFNNTNYLGWIAHKNYIIFSSVRYKKILAKIKIRKLTILTGTFMGNQSNLIPFSFSCLAKDSISIFICGPFSNFDAKSSANEIEEIHDNF